MARRRSAAAVEQLYDINKRLVGYEGGLMRLAESKRLVGYEGGLMRLAESHGVTRQDFLRTWKLDRAI
jgi:hypothetical protein